MKKSFLILSLVGFIGFTSCKTTCKYNEIEIPCDQLDAYNTFKSQEAAINATFENNNKPMTTQEELNLRETLVSFYDANKLAIDAADELIDHPFDPTRIYEIRTGEIEYFKEKIVEEAILEEFKKLLDVKEYEADTCFYEDCEPRKYLIWEIKNNSDSIISGVSVEQIVEVNGELLAPKTATYYMLSHNQITPQPAQDSAAVVAPGSTLLLTFRTSETRKAKPVLKGIYFHK